MKLKVDKEKGSKRGRLEAITESRGDNQGDEKKGKTCTRRSSTGTLFMVLLMLVPPEFAVVILLN